MPKNPERPGGGRSHLLKAARSSPFLQHNLVFFTGSLAVAVLNYLFYPVLSRLLKPADFGEVQTLTSLFTQAAIFLTILSYVTIHVTRNVIDEEERNRTLLGLERIAMVGGYFLLAIALLSVEKLRVFLNFSEIWPFVALIVALAFSIPLAFRMAFLRGRRQFARASLTDGIGSASKLVLAPILVLLGLRSFGAIGGLALSQAVSLVFGMAWAHQAGFKGFGLHAKVSSSWGALRPHLHHALAVLLAAGCVTVMQTLDIVAIKHYFSPEQAGLYAGVTTIAGIIYFLMAPVTGVLVTLVSLHQPAGQNRLQLKGSLALMITLGGSALAVMALFPELVISLLVGSKYLAYSSYLWRVGLMMMLLAIANTLLMYHVALKHYKYGVTAAIVLMLTLGQLYLHHASIVAVINGILAGSFAMVFLTAVQALLFKNRAREETNV